MTCTNDKKVRKIYARLAQTKAKQSICRFQVSALGFNSDGDCVAKAVNTPRFVRKGGGLHAEQHIFRIAKRKGVVTILICRVGSSGRLLPIHPCPICQKTADSLGIRIITVI